MILYENKMVEVKLKISKYIILNLSPISILYPTICFYLL